jgi:sugar lactone lactonase YvrE
MVGRATTCALAAVMLTACGGGGGGGGYGGGTPPPTTYTIGGTISGLSASGLTLDDNGGNTLMVASGATMFTFSTALASGAAYAVTVASQPTGETCTVTSGTGTATANVTSVAIACTATAQTFTISGTITGLTAAGLKLQYYSGGEVLSVATAATTFAFTQPVPSGTNVKMTVAAQPGFQVCTPGASDFSGPITANITTDTLSCAVATATVSLFAGLANAHTGNGNGTGSAASFNSPAGVAMDSAGNLYVADFGNNEIRKITTPGAVVTTFAGAGGTTFDGPAGVAVDSAGNVYVADQNHDQIDVITPAGVVSVFAGSGTAGNANGTGTGASFHGPKGIAIDSLGNLWVADSTNDEIRKITTPGAVVTTWAGTGSAGNANGSGTSASFNNPVGIAVDSSGDLYVADFGNNEIREINSQDVVSTFVTAAAGLNGPYGVALDSGGNLYVTDSANQAIKMVTPNAVVTTLAGGSLGDDNGTGSTAQFNFPFGIVVDASGDLYVGDFGNNEIRELVP